MKIKEYIAEKILNFVFKNSSLKEMEEKVATCQSNIASVASKMADYQDITLLREDVDELFSLCSVLENTINEKTSRLSHSLKKIQAPAPVVDEPEAGSISIIPAKYIKSRRRR